MKKFLLSFAVLTMAMSLMTACSDDDDASGKIEPAALAVDNISIEEADTLNGATFTFNVPNAKSDASYFLAFGSDPNMKVYTLSKADMVDGKYQATVYLLDRSKYYSYRVVEMSNSQITAQSAKLGEYRLGNEYDMSYVTSDDVEISDITLNSARVTLIQPQNAAGVKFYVFYSADENMEGDVDTLELARNDEGNYYGDLVNLNQSTNYYFKVVSLKDHIYSVSADLFEFVTLGDPTFEVTVSVDEQNINMFGSETLETITEKLRKEFASEGDNYCFVEPEGYNKAVDTFSSTFATVRGQYSVFVDQVVNQNIYKVDTDAETSVTITVTMTNVNNPEETYSSSFTVNTMM